MITLLRSYQREAVDSVINSINNRNKKIMLQFAVGAGLQTVIIEIIKLLLEQNKISNILLLTSTRALAYQLSDNLQKHLPHKVCNYLTKYNNEPLVVTTYTDFSKNHALLLNYEVSNLINFNLVICLDAQNSDYGQTEEYLSSMNAFLIGCFNIEITQNKESFWSDAHCVFKYSTIDAIKDGYINPNPGVEEPLIYAISDRMEELGFSQVSFDSSLKLSSIRNIKPDMLFEDEKQFIIIEIKAYRGRQIPVDVISTAVNQIIMYRNSIIHSNSEENIKQVDCCLILLCEIDSTTKQNYYEKHGVTIWDVSNLIYFFQDHEKYIHILKNIINYSISSISPAHPVGWYPAERKTQEKKINEEADLEIVEKLIEKLLKCKTGKSENVSTQYEKICTDVISFLFSDEFTKCSNQHNTGDNLFRMDLLCGLKGSSEFWRFLIRYYNSKFVVFEFKNYNDQIPQNLIYITEKYLFNAALRNVAIIVSRKGFSEGATKAALGELKESNKLIISLTDDDLIIMLRMKVDGQEPSDHLLSKVEETLMSISK